MKSFDQLYQELTDKIEQRPEGSASVALLDQGIHAVGKKLLEEAGEAWMAAEFQSDDQLALEVSQVLYYAQLILIARGVPLERVYERL